MAILVNSFRYFFVGEIVTVGFLLFWFGIAGLITMVVSLFTTQT